MEKVLVFPKETACHSSQLAAVAARGVLCALCESFLRNVLRIVLANCLEDRFANCLLWREFRFCFAGLSESSGAFSGSFALFLSAF